MELFQGRPLSQWIRSHRLNRDGLKEMELCLMRECDWMASKGIAHRDWADRHVMVVPQGLLGSWRTRIVGLGRAADIRDPVLLAKTVATDKIQIMRLLQRHARDRGLDDTAAYYERQVARYLWESEAEES
jgi:hypothetical protein